MRPDRGFSRYALRLTDLCRISLCSLTIASLISRTSHLLDVTRARTNDDTTTRYLGTADSVFFLEKTDAKRLDSSTRVLEHERATSSIDLGRSISIRLCPFSHRVLNGWYVFVSRASTVRSCCRMTGRDPHGKRQREREREIEREIDREKEAARSQGPG